MVSALKQRIIRLGAVSIAAALLVGCSSAGTRYAGQDGCANAQACPVTAASYTSGSRYGSEGHCEIEWRCGWGVNWVKVPTYHQILVPTLRQAPPVLHVEAPEEPSVYVPPAPVYVPPVVEQPPIYVPEPQPEPQPPVYVPPQSYPEPPVYIPPTPVLRK